MVERLVKWNARFAEEEILRLVVNDLVERFGLSRSEVSVERLLNSIRRNGGKVVVRHEAS